MLGARRVTGELVMPDRVAEGEQTEFWRKGGVKRVRPYFAAFVICFLAGVIGIVTLPFAPEKIYVLLLPFLGTVGIGAVWLLFMGRRMQRDLDKDSNEANLHFLRRFFYAIVLLAAVVAVALMLCVTLVSLL